MEKTINHQRYRFIELMAYWEGRINATILKQQFGLSRQQCSDALNAYVKQAPENLQYDASSKVYLPLTTFQRQYISDDVMEYFLWLQNGSAALENKNEQEKPLFLPNAALNLPARKVSPEVMRILTTAIRKQRRIEVDYVSLNNPNREGRIIAPHTFINTGLRWHLRAWCEKSRAYRDFVLSRFRGQPELKDRSDHTAEQDTAWNTLITVILQPDQRLSPEKREVLENDYQMQNGQLHIRTRACLVNYLLREMQINTKMLDGTPEAQQLVCVNLLDIKQWLFEG